MSEPIPVDIWSDVACPWCYIGKRRFEAAVATLTEADPDVAVDVTYHSFELMPDAPETFDGSAAEYLAAAKGLPVEQTRAMQDHVAGIAAEVGLDYDFASQQPTNTNKANQLLHLARAHGLQVAMKERLMAAHFVEGRHVGRDDDLAALAADVGLDPDAVRTALREGTYAAAVAEDVAAARRIGIGGVPFYVLDRRYGVSGAQPSEVFVQALTRVVAERREGTAA